MNIAFIHPRWPGSEGTGATHSATQIVETVGARGHDITVYCPVTSPNDEKAREDIRFIDTDSASVHSGTALNRRLRSSATELAQYDIVHSYLMQAIPALDNLSKTHDTPTVVTLNAYAGICPKNDLRYMDSEPCRENGLLRCAKCSLATSGDHPEHGALYQSISRLGNLRLINSVDPERLSIDGFHALSGHVKRTYARFRYPSDRIDVIPNILDETFRVTHRSDFEEPYKLLYVGSLDEHKGVGMLPEVLDRLVTDSPYRFEMTVVGTGGLSDSLATAVAERGLGSAIEFRGQVPNDQLPAVYAAHDLFLYPGVWDEPFGRIFIESLAAGTPVVGTDVGAVAEIIGDAGTVTQATPEALATCIVETVQDSRLRTYAEATTQEVVQYSAKNVGDRFETLYRRVRDRR